MKRNKKKTPEQRRQSISRLLAPLQRDGMRAAGRLAAELLDHVAGRIRPGVTTLEIDTWVDELTRARGATSAPWGYGGHGAPPFKGHCCTSVNDVVWRGIPSASHVLSGGGIVHVDVTPNR